MGFSETDSSRCRNHPNNRQAPGVCSFCLREQLNKLNTSPSSFNRKKTTFISNSSSFSSSPLYSSSSATAAAGRQHRRNGSDAYVSVGMVLNNGLKKSRSVSCANLSSRSKLGANTHNNNNNDVMTEKIKGRVNVNEVDEGNSVINLKKKNNGFLKKLINNTSKKTKGVLMHSKTMKERSHSSLNPTAVTIKN